MVEECIYDYTMNAYAWMYIFVPWVWYLMNVSVKVCAYPIKQKPLEECISINGRWTSTDECAYFSQEYDARRKYLFEMSKMRSEWCIHETMLLVCDGGNRGYAAWGSSSLTSRGSPPFQQSCLKKFVSNLYKCLLVFVPDIAWFLSA